MSLALPFLLLVAIILPLLGWLSLRHRTRLTEDEAAALSTRGMITQLLALQTIVGGLAWLALYGTGLSLTWWSDLSAMPVLVCLGVWLVFVVIAVKEANRPLARQDRWRAELRKTAASDPVWIGVTLYAGIVEEFAYRGVLTLTLAATLGNWPAVAISALAFGLGHLSGGWRAALFAIPFALAMQTIVYVSGGLFLAVVTHAAYDLSVAWLGHRKHRQQR